MMPREETGRSRRIDLITRAGLLLAWGLALIGPPVLITWMLWAPWAGEHYVSANRTYISLGATGWYGYTYTASSGKGNQWYSTQGIILAVLGSVLVWAGAITAHLLTRRWIVSVLIRPANLPAPRRARDPRPSPGFGVGFDPDPAPAASLATPGFGFIESAAFDSAAFEPTFAADFPPTPASPSGAVQFIPGEPSDHQQPPSRLQLRGRWHWLR